MKIPKNLQLEDKEVLLIVSSKQGASFYHLHGEDIELVDSFKMPKPEYTDFEGELSIRGRGMTKSIISHFLRNFREHLSKLRLSITKIYLFAPAQTKNKIADTLPQESRNKLEKVVSGSFSRFHPLELLEKIYFVSA